MPLLAAWLSSMFSGFVSLFAFWFGRKFALGMAMAVIFGGMTAALYAALSLALNGLAVSLPSWPGMEMAMYVAAPTNLPTAVGALISAEATIALYVWNTKLFKLVSGGAS